MAFPLAPADDATAALAELERFERAYRARLTDLDRALVELRAERDRAIRDAYRAGVLVGRISRVFRLSHQRVSRIVRGR